MDRYRFLPFATQPLPSLDSPASHILVTYENMQSTVRSAAHQFAHQRGRSIMRVAALYDIHGNLPALEAVLEELRQANVDQIVVGGDVVPGPMPRESLQRLLDLNRRVHFLHGNGELAMLALLSAPNEGAVTYWGTTSGQPL